MKSVKIAEIVPLQCIELTANNQYHMCLAQVADQSDAYAYFFKRMSQEGKYVLLDNGAAEGDHVDEKTMEKILEYVQPSEIVLPDTLKDAKKTISDSSAYFRKYCTRRNIKMMVVPQGKTFSEWCDCAKALMNEIRVTTVGVPKHLPITAKDPWARVKACSFLKNYDVEVHLLGCNENPVVIDMCRRTNNKVRGCDSAFAYLASLEGCNSIDLFTKRPKSKIDFIDGPMTSNLEDLMADFERIAGVDNNFMANSWL